MSDLTTWELQERLDIQKKLNLALIEENEKQRQHIARLASDKIKLLNKLSGLGIGSYDKKN